MIRIYVKYTEWEDWINGMWDKLSVDEESDMLLKCINFTGDYVKYGYWMEKVIYQWPNTMKHNLTNVSLNRLAFIGHCAASLAIKSPEYITRKAWRELSPVQRSNANGEALRCLNLWLDGFGYKKIH